ncbi:NAD-dependent protein deacetylase sirtuin-2 [Parelaphostrongylus tenuis]|uniref:NAD-dependent protein deacetylase sirtuin-2 n=1 Tax=Parelaphostrongylus tenuis TaxID=148309 RepID=A0AAD5QGL6_PARTN|nr:NAD-dependent protein deacetylase sirtuin-2 [Parelaphostrongylus tenuis]
MSDDKCARSEKKTEEEETSRIKSEEAKPSGSAEMPRKDIYSRFVNSFESALNSLTSTVSSAVGGSAERRCLEKSKLKSFTLEGIAEFIKTERPSRVIVMSGAGISTSAGIPDFRSPGSGLYDNLQKYNLPDPQAIFDISFFRKNPEPFFELSKELFRII